MGGPNDSGDEKEGHLFKGYMGGRIRTYDHGLPGQGLIWLPWLSSIALTTWLRPVIFRA